MDWSERHIDNNWLYEGAAGGGGGGGGVCYSLFNKI